MNWFFPHGSLSQDDWEVVVNQRIPGWKHTGLRVASLIEGNLISVSADSHERIVMSLSAPLVIVDYKVKGESNFTHVELKGRTSVFDGTVDHLYLPIETEFKITGVGRVAIAEAPATNPFPVRLIAANEVPVMARGAGPATREVHNFGMPNTLDADRFIVVEVIVPAGNWSGVPAHKHDTYIPGKESNLEEIYYFESTVAKGLTAPQQSSPHGIFRGYASDERPYDLTTAVHSGDVVLVPYGWHGPVGASPGYDLYFLNVMAGPDPDRAWNVTNDPHHDWIQGTWQGQEQDSRVRKS